MIPVHVDGASGYGAGELIRLVSGHPEFSLGELASKSSAGKPLEEVFPSLAPLGLTFSTEEQLVGAVRPGDAVVYAGEAARAPARVVEFLDCGAKVVDLSAGFRLQDRHAYPTWYGFEHPHVELLLEAAYGMPELHHDLIAASRLVANPGCYPTATLLALAPLVTQTGNRIARIAVDAKSGISGAGRTPQASSLFSEVDGTVRPYGIGSHRHAPEIAEQLRALGCTAPFVFAPHVVPLSRGLLATCYVWFDGSAPPGGQLPAMFSQAYDGRPLVFVMPAGELPETRAVTGTARAAVGAVRVADDVVIAACAIDNLGKGAAGQAVQNLNLMYEFKEEAGLDALAAVA